MPRFGIALGHGVALLAPPRAKRLNKCERARLEMVTESFWCHSSTPNILDCVSEIGEVAEARVAGGSTIIVLASFSRVVCLAEN